jgi:hypothetical protein
MEELAEGDLRMATVNGKSVNVELIEPSASDPDAWHCWAEIPGDPRPASGLIATPKNARHQKRRHPRTDQRTPPE